MRAHAESGAHGVSSGDKRIMELLRHLLYGAARRGFTLEVRYVPTRDNGAADALSRGELARFQALHATARPSPDPLPPGLEAYLAEPAAGPEPLTGYIL